MILHRLNLTKLSMSATMFGEEELSEEESMIYTRLSTKYRNRIIPILGRLSLARPILIRKGGRIITLVLNLMKISSIGEYFLTNMT